MHNKSKKHKNLNRWGGRGGGSFFDMRRLFYKQFLISLLRSLQLYNTQPIFAANSQGVIFNLVKFWWNTKTCEQASTLENKKHRKIN